MGHFIGSLALAATLCLAHPAIAGEAFQGSAESRPPVPPVFADSFGLNPPEKPLALREAVSRHPSLHSRRPVANSFGLNGQAVTAEAGCPAQAGEGARDQARCIEI